MWDEIIIGSGPEAVTSINMHLADVKVSISQNSFSYWISSCFLGVSMKIYKNTEEGKKLTQIMKERHLVASRKTIDNFLDQIVLKHLKKSQLLGYIKRSNEEHFKNGRESAQEEMRQALGI